MNWQGKAQRIHRLPRQPLNKLMKYVTPPWKRSAAAQPGFLALMVLVNVSSRASLGSAWPGSFTAALTQTYRRTMQLEILGEMYRRFVPAVGLAKKPRNRSVAAQTNIRCLVFLFTIHLLEFWRAE